MFSAAYRKCLATAMVVAALAIALPVSGASADYGSHPGATPEVAPPPSSIATSAADEYQNLRAATQQPVVAEPSEPSGFDLVSAAIGAAVAGGLSLLLMASLSARRPTRRRPASA
jgi:hypothetical protein